jgi:chromosome segregation ATPase
VRQVAEEDLEPLVLVRTEEQTTPFAGTRQAPLEEAVAPVAPPQPAESEAPTADVFGKAAERVAESMVEFWSVAMGSVERRCQAEDAKLEAASNGLERVQGEVEELRDSIGAQQRFMETQVLAALARIDQRLERLDNAVQSQAQAIAGLGAAKEGLEQAQHAVQKRLDTQAEVVRELSDAAGVQRDRWAQYRSAVEKLREITDVTNQPMQLPENL